MEHWEFLIQKQGERTWLPLESPQQEIIEGKYRLVARSSRANTEVEVRITHHSTLEFPPKRRIQKRSRRTNDEGLMVVMPFTNLKPGTWELQCSGDIMSDFLGQSWQYGVKLEVLPRVVSVLAGDIPDTPPSLVAPSLEDFPQSRAEEINAPEVAPTEPEFELEAFDEREFAIHAAEPVAHPVWLKGMTAEQILESLIESALPPIELDWEDDMEWDEEPAPVISTSPLALQLALERDSYMARWGTSLTLNGRVELPIGEDMGVDSAAGSTTVYDAELVVELRNPQRSQVLAQVRQPLPTQSLPLSFSCSVEIPADCQSKLILADVSLHGCLSSGQSPVLLATQPFMITAELAELLEILVAQRANPLGKDADPLLDFPFSVDDEFAPEVVEIDLELFNLVKQPKPDLTQHFQPINSNPFPERIAPPEHQPKIIGSPQLPHFLPVIPPEFKVTHDTDSLASSNQPVDINQALVPLQQPDSLTSEGEFLPAQTPVDSAFQALNLQQRFLSRLNAMAADEELVDTIGSEPSTVDIPEEEPQESLQALVDSLDKHVAELTEPEPELEPVVVSEEIPDHNLTSDDESIAQTPLSPNLTNPIPPRVMQEFVVDDTSITQPKSRFYSRRTQPEEQPTPITIPLTPVDLEPLPTPELLVPTGELTSGQPLEVQVRLAVERPQIVLKLWIQDCQTRSIIDGPHWLALTPNGLGELEATTHLMVPFGCLAMWLGAIAIDMTTQQESHKVSVERTVVPPDIPQFDLEQF